MKNPQATNPCEESTREVLERLMPEKDVIEELDVLSFDKHHSTFVFNGSFQMANSTLYVGDKIVTERLTMLGECNNAISGTNKRLLEEHNIPTDYLTPNPMLPRALGFTEEEAKLLVYALNLEDMPIRLKITGYCKANGEKLKTAKVTAHLPNTEEAISDEEAISIIADYLLDNEFVLSSFELEEEFDSIEEVHNVIELSEAAKSYAEGSGDDDFWDNLEFALTYELAADYFRNMAYLALQAYAVLSDKYEESDFILAETSFNFGLDTDDTFCITGSVGNFNNSLIVNKADFISTGKFVQCHLEPLMVHYDKEGLDAPIPESVLDKMSDTVLYVAEGLVDDLEFDLYIN